MPHSEKLHDCIRSVERKQLKEANVCMAFTKKITLDTKENLLTRQSSLFKRERRGDSPRVIANRLTCQRSLCNRRERQGDSPRVIVNRLTCQRALCNRRKRQGDSQRVTVTDLGLAQRCKIVFSAKRTLPDLTRIYMYQSLSKLL
jgi:hypothetical protein